MRFCKIDETALLSGPVHRAVNDEVRRSTNGDLSDWGADFYLYIKLDGNFELFPRVSGSKHQKIFGSFNHPVVFVPTPDWVQGTQQKCYVCFVYETPEMMKDFGKMFILLSIDK